MSTTQGTTVSDLTPGYRAELARSAAIVEAYLVNRITGDWSDEEIVAAALPEAHPRWVRAVVWYMTQA